MLTLGSSRDEKLDAILERLDRLEKRIEAIEKKR